MYLLQISTMRQKACVLQPTLKAIAWLKANYAEQGRQRIPGFPDANIGLVSADVFSSCSLLQERYNPLEPAPQEEIPVLSWNGCF